MRLDSFFERIAQSYAIDPRRNICTERSHYQSYGTELERTGFKSKPRFHYHHRARYSSNAVGDHSASNSETSFARGTWTFLIILCSAVWQPFTVRDIPSLYQRMASSEISSQSRMLETTKRVGRRFMTTDRTGLVAQLAGVEQTDGKTRSRLKSVEVFEDRTVPGGAM